MKNIFNSSTWVNRIEGLEINRPKYFSALIACIFLFASFVVTVPRGASAATRPGVSLEQCANKDLTCDSDDNAKQWQTGNLNHSNSTFAEGDSVPYRSGFIHLTAGQTYLVSIEWDTTKSGKHAIDYLTSFDATESKAFPCAGIKCGEKYDSLPIETDSHVKDEGVEQLAGQFFKVFGGMFPAKGKTIENTGNLCADSSCPVGSNHGSYKLSGEYKDSSSTSVELMFTAEDSTVVLSWGGHLATQKDWGEGKSASAIAGSPYHMRLLDFRCSNVKNCSAGNMDRSLQLDDSCNDSSGMSVEKESEETPSCDSDCDGNEDESKESPCSTTSTSSTSTSTSSTSTSTSTTSTTVPLDTTTSTTSTSTSSTSTSSSSTSSSSTSTSTTVPVDVTTTTIGIFSETTVPRSSTTTVPVVTTTTTPVVTTTSVAGGSINVSNTTPVSIQDNSEDFQNIIPAVTANPSDTYDVLIPDGLPMTGAQLSILFFAILMLLVTGGVFMKVSQVQVRRNKKDEDQ